MIDTTKLNNKYIGSFPIASKQNSFSLKKNIHEAVAVCLHLRNVCIVFVLRTAKTTTKKKKSSVGLAIGHAVVPGYVY